MALEPGHPRRSESHAYHDQAVEEELEHPFDFPVKVAGAECSSLLILACGPLFDRTRLTLHARSRLLLAGEPTAPCWR
jgi:hypothetical protein